MDGALAQLLAIVTHGNAWLESAVGDPPNLLQENSTFRYVKEVRFEFERRWGRSTAWDGTDTWLEEHHLRGADPLLLDSRGWTNPDLANVGSAGAPRGAIIARGSRSLEVWACQWLTDWDPITERPPDQRIWLVTYKGQRAGASPHPKGSRVDDALAELLAALEAIRDFAREQEVEGWPEWFDEAIGMGGSEDPQIPYHPDAIPADTPVDGRRLTAVAFKAWVFGGMGSWNDKFIKDPSAAKRDRIVSERLYGAILGALDAVANA